MAAETAARGRPGGRRPASLLDLRLVFVTGKGGVGKTTVAAALAQLAARRGKHVLACEIDAKGDLAAQFEAAPTDFDGTEVTPGVVVMSMDTEASLREYLKLYLRLPFGRFGSLGPAATIGPLAKALDFVAAAAPGVREILTVGKLCYEVRERNYDLVVVDASATGHIVSQLAAPQAINELVKVGLIRSQTDWMLDILSDPVRTGLVAVTTPEEMPVNETLELARRVATETTVQLSAVAVNRVLPELFGHREEEVFESLHAHGAEVAKVTGADPDPLVDVLEGARLAMTMRRTRAGHLRRLADGLGALSPGTLPVAAPVLYLPYQFGRMDGLRATRQVATALGEELGL